MRGTVLSFSFDKGECTGIVEEILQSNRNLKLTYTPNSDGSWDIAIESTPLNIDTRLLMPDRMSSLRFRSDVADSVRDGFEKLNLEGVPRSGEPQRLLKYFRENKKEFELSS